MNGVLSMVALDTLSGWPAVQDPTVLQTLGLLVGFPIVVIAIVVLLSKASSLAKAGRGENVSVTDPVWVGGRSTAPLEGVATERAALEAGVAEPAGDDEPADVGGAGARW